MSWSLRFLGVGNAQAAMTLGSASAVIEHQGRPVLMIDCGQEALAAFERQYVGLPDALFITHVHMDHVAGLERLFFATYFDPARRGKVRLYVPVGVLPHLQSRLADYPGVVAEGDANWWDAFQLVPVTRGFWHGGQWYDVFPVRHHLPDTAFALRLPGSVVWTGDTRPIPEMLAKFADAGETVAHDCALHGNPSHSGVDDLEREYPRGLLARCVLYHYASAADAEALRARGHRVAEPGECLPLSGPAPGMSR
ncbi:MBL fold metallo-hydrolase [Arenimonas daejeonensis]|uniref:MBL fold metallo-hydrolase n=1 Tax=Arenimonas daejeonensis TaxID=370777 RepID=UPI0011BE982F|nr:MBL fold metallo-hydrolase [Arenimonas daejeonensis]